VGKSSGPVHPQFMKDVHEVTGVVCEGVLSSGGGNGSALGGSRSLGEETGHCSGRTQTFKGYK